MRKSHEKKLAVKGEIGTTEKMMSRKQPKM
jgi:hypothetical protein